MSNPISSTTPSAPAPQPQSPPVPAFLETAGKTTQIIIGILAGIAAVGSFGIGVTFTPFAPEVGAGALALATALFGVAGFLIYSALNSRNISSQSQ